MTFSVFRRRQVRWLQDLLMLHADALVSGSPAREQLLEVTQSEGATQLGDLLALAERIDQALGGVAPSEQFVAQLHQRLLSDEAPDLYGLTWWERIRQLPLRTQVAAGIGGATLTAGVVILATRSVNDVLGHWRARRTATA